MQAPKPPLVTVSPKPLGLKIIADSSFFDSPCKSNCVKRIQLAASPPPHLSPSSFMEEEEDAMEDVAEEEEDDACWATYGRRSPARRLPPPIPFLARTGKLTCHMPWVLKRINGDDGRLVIQEVRVERHGYFRARRREGRLTLHLMELHGPQCSVSAPRSDKEKKIYKEMIAVVHSDRNYEISLSSSSSSSEEENWIYRDNGRSLTSPMSSSKMMLSSSILSEPVCGNKGFEKDGARPLHLELPTSRMRMVHG